jgi:hypothetical protein
MRVFISHRRSDSGGIPQLLKAHLEDADAFGKGSVILDVAARWLGEDFRQPVAEALTTCDAVLVVMGPRWVGAASDGSRRIDQEKDYVRFEVTTALQRKGLQVVPILIDGLEIGQIDLPEELESLQFRGGIPIRTDMLADDVKPLIEHLQRFDPDSRPDERRLTAVRVRGEVDWLQPELSSGPLLGCAEEGGSTPGLPSSIALSLDGALVAQVIHSVLTVYGLADRRSGTFERWRSLSLDDFGRRPKVVAIGARGPRAVRIALSYEAGSSTTSWIARFALHHDGTVERASAVGKAATGAFVGSTLLYVDEYEKRVFEWRQREDSPRRWSKDPGVKPLSLDAAIHDGRPVVVVLGVDESAGQTRVTHFCGDDDVPRGSQVAPERSRQLVVPRDLTRTGVGGLRAMVHARDWLDVALG